MNGRTGLLMLMLGCLLLVSLPGSAQVKSLTSQNLSTINIDEIPDTDILLYLQKARENGLSDETMYRLLLQKGLPEQEMDKLMERISNLSLPDKSALTEKETSLNKEETGRKFPERTTAFVRQQLQPDLTVFGSELFTITSLGFEPNLRIATPAGYILGPDDELVVNVFGFSEKSYRLTVNEEGNIFIPQVGPLHMNGLTIEQASSRIRSKLASTIYRAMKSGATRVQISLGKIRSIRVTVVGEAKKPGTYTVSSLTTVFNLLYLCGGPSDMGSYRTIELVRGNEVKRKIDLYRFLLQGSQQDNVMLNEGDVVRIPYYRNRVIVNGYARRKGKFELLDNENFNDVLNFCGGFADDAYRSSVTIYQYTDQERKIMDLDKNGFASYRPRSGDSVLIGKLLSRFENKLIIKGAVMRPGEFELTEGTTLKELINKAGGLKEDAYSRRGSISRLNASNLPVQVAFDVDSVMNGLSIVKLRKNDSINIYSIFDLENKITVSIDGNVKNPGVYPWAQHVTLRDMILRAGGFTEQGDNRNIEIARRIRNVKLNEINHLQTEIIAVDLSDSSGAADINLEPYDVINVRQKADFMSQRTVFVEGMVLRPGRYTLKMSGDRISDIIQRAGGFRANADTTALVIRRLSKRAQTVQDREQTFSKLLNINSDSLKSAERIKREIYKDYDKISIDLKKALHDRNETDNMLLEDGDILSIEQNNSLVKVSGEVYYPTIIPFKKGATLRYYIQKSGSYTELAHKNGTMVVYPDGKAKKVKHFLFFKSYPEVVSRSEIFVPQKNNKNKGGISLAEWSVILSSLAIVANVIINLRN